MPNIDWYGSDFGPGSTGERVSYTEPVAKAVKHKALAIAYKASWLLDSKPKTRTGESDIQTMHYPSLGARASTGPNIDSFVILTDPNGGDGVSGYSPGRWRMKGGAQGIENGHRVYNKEGRVVGKVEGLHILKEALDG